MLTLSLITQLRAAIFADAVAAPLLAAGNHPGLRGYLNSIPNPAFVVWRDSVLQDEIMQNGFDWSRVDNLSVGKARIWEWLFDNQQTSINPSKANVRAGIDSTWVGTAADLAVRAAVYLHCKRDATQAEKMLTGGTGTTETPAVSAWNGEISDWDASMLIWHDNGTIWQPGD